MGKALIILVTLFSSYFIQITFANGKQNRDNLFEKKAIELNEFPIGDFYPLEIGNTWKYAYYSMNPDGVNDGSFTREVIGDTLVSPSNKTYAIILQTNDSTGAKNKLFHRVDNTNNAIYYLDTSSGRERSFATKTSSSLGSIEIFGNQFISFVSDKSYKDTDERTFAHGIGMTSSNYWSFTWGSVYKEDLISCNVNGNLYMPTKLSTTSENTFVIFPNPVKNTLYIKYERINQCRIQITNLQGVVLLSCNGSNSVDVSNFKQGIYVLEILGSNSIVLTRNFLKF